MTTEIKMCEWKMCTEKATTTEAYNGILYHVCKTHKEAIKQQKKADNNV